MLNRKYGRCARLCWDQLGTADTACVKACGCQAVDHPVPPNELIARVIGDNPAICPWGS